LTNPFTAEIDVDTLKLTVAGLSDIAVGPRAYGDGSGELRTLIDDLLKLKSSYDVSSIISLINLAIGNPQFKTLDEIKSFIAGSTSKANSLSSALRSTFSGWNRRIITNNKTAFLAWLPVHSVLEKYSLLWIRSGINDWAVIVGGDTQSGCKKVGIAFVQSKPVGSTTDVKIL
jgi:hypothetical protein